MRVFSPGTRLVGWPKRARKPHRTLHKREKSRGAYGRAGGPFGHPSTSVPTVALGTAMHAKKRFGLHAATVHTHGRLELNFLKERLSVWPVFSHIWGGNDRVVPDLPRTGLFTKLFCFKIGELKNKRMKKILETLLEILGG